MPQLQSWSSFSSFIQDTVDIKLPQGYALVFQQKGMLHAGLGNNMKIVDYVTFPSPLIALCIGPFLREAWTLFNEQACVIFTYIWTKNQGS